MRFRKPIECGLRDPGIRWWYIKTNKNMRHAHTTRMDRSQNVICVKYLNNECLAIASIIKYQF
jgi:hypothetical protein